MKNNFDVIKYFKEIYGIINIRNVVSVIIKDGVVYFPSDPFYLTYSRLFEVDDDVNHFSKWIQDKKTSMELPNLFELKGIRKKDVIDLVSTDKEYTIKYTTKENEEEVKTFTCPELKELDKDLRSSFEQDAKKVKELEATLGERIDIPFNFFENEEIFEVYLDENNKIVKTRTPEKVLEIPTNKIVSLMKNPDEVFIRIGTRDELGRRCVAIGSKNSLVESTQLFITI